MGDASSPPGAAGTQACVSRSPSFRRTLRFFIGFDSDGCVFDTMELKHKECFCPAFVNVLGLQAVSRCAREVWEFVNLYSRTRGTNRYIALLRALELLSVRPEVQSRGFSVPRLSGLGRWIESGANLSKGSLERAVFETHDPDLELALAWSTEVEDAVRRIARNVPPFPFVRETLEALAGRADVAVISQTPAATVEREWGEYGIARYAGRISGQEMGTKTEQLGSAAGAYAAGRILMVGDAPGDGQAAADIGALFFPIVPHRETESWERLYREGLERFFTGSFAGRYQRELLSEFEAALPTEPPWNR